MKNQNKGTQTSRLTARYCRLKMGAALLALAMMPFAAIQSTAAVVAYVVPQGTIGNDGFSGSMGMDFDVHQDIEVSHLGVFDSGADGFVTSAIRAHLYDRNSPSSPLASFSFTPSNPGTLIDGSRFFALSSPLILPAGFQGRIVAEGFNWDDLYANVGITSRPIIIPGGQSLSTDDGGGLISFVGSSPFGNYGQYPTNISYGGPENRYAAGTFIYSAFVLDSDGDGLPDDVDGCPNSDLGDTVTIAGCDSGVPNQLFGTGCTLADLVNTLVAECAAGAKNHGKFVSCVSQGLNQMKKSGLISGSEKGALTSCAAQADLP